MGLFSLPEDVVLDALIHKRPDVRMEKCVNSFPAILAKALKKDRRVLAFLESYQVKSSKKSVLSVVTSYDVSFIYRENAPDKIDDIILCDDTWEIDALLAPVEPLNAVLVTDDPDRIVEMLNHKLYYFLGLYEGLFGFNTRNYTFEEAFGDWVVEVNFGYLLSKPQLNQMKVKAGFAAKTIWKKILGRAKVPKFVMPFLALSYITQECQYDERAFQEVVDYPDKIPTDPITHLAYGPLVEERGICGGLAWAFKTLMDEAGIKCICVCGLLKEDTRAFHMWNIVSLEQSFYHVDPSSGIKDKGVYISELMQPDNIYSVTHIWNVNNYPAARGNKFDYDFVEDFLAKNGAEYLGNGADEKYMFPQNIVE